MPSFDGRKGESVLCRLVVSRVLVLSEAFVREEKDSPIRLTATLYKKKKNLADSKSLCVLIQARLKW